MAIIAFQKEFSPDLPNVYGWKAEEFFLGTDDKNYSKRKSEKRRTGHSGRRSVSWRSVDGGFALTGRERQDVASAAPRDGFTAAGQGDPAVD